MPATVADLGVRVLRRLGVAVVPASERPTLTATVSVASLAQRALDGLGVVVAAADRPNAAATVSVATLGTRALEALGVVVPQAERPASAGTATVTEIAARALERLAVVVPASVRPSLSGTVTQTAIAVRALEGLGVVVPASERPSLTSTVSVTAIAVRALQWLGVIAADETASANDQAVAEDKVYAVHASLVAQGAASWATTAIPITVVEEMTMLAAMHMAAEFGKTADPAQRPVIEERVRRVSLIFRAQGLAEAKVQAVHDALVAQGIASWTMTTVPAAVAEEYAIMARQMLAPEFGQAADMTQWAAMQARVKRTTLIMRAQTVAEAKVAAVHDELAGLATVPWAVSAIPLAVAEPYAVLAMLHMAMEFDAAVDSTLRPAMVAQVRQYSLLARAQTLAETRISTVHDDLIGKASVTWGLSAIPAAVSEAYVRLAAIRLAPEFDKQVDVAAEPVIQADVRQYALLAKAQTLAETRIQSVHDQLVAQGAIGWASTAIPQAVADEYATMARVHLAPEFGQKADLSVLPVIEDRVRRFSMVARGPALAEQKVVAVHAGLDARGKTRWTLFDIPSYVEEPYVVLAANLLAPEFKMPPDMVAEQRAVRELAQAISLPSAGQPVVAEYF